ncbi:MAG: hypothetical protein U5L11_16425 [Arhodomonas sp.]|nr:hypothetical protein [Arhodomonas sp.]
MASESAEMRELEALVRELQARNVETCEALDEALAEIATTRRMLAVMRADREAEQAGSDDWGDAHGRRA